MLRIAVLLVVICALAGCANSPTCYRITSADTWVSGGPNSYDDDTDNFNRRGRYTGRSKSDGSGWNVETGVNFHWDSTCEYEYEYEYYEEEEVIEEPNNAGQVTPTPGGSGAPTRR